MLESARFEEKKEKKLDFPHDEECPKMFGISNIVSHIRMESEVAWDDPRPDIRGADSGPMSVLSIKVVSHVSYNFAKSSSNVKPFVFLSCRDC